MFTCTEKKTECNAYAVCSGCNAHVACVVSEGAMNTYTVVTELCHFSSSCYCLRGFTVVADVCTLSRHCGLTVAACFGSLLAPVL